MRILLTGAGGFVAPYVVEALRAAVPAGFELLATGLVARHEPRIGPVESLDITDDDAVDRLIAKAKPTHVVHLAGITAQPAAAADPNLAWKVNTLGALNCARSLLRHVPEAAFIFAGSSQAYGRAPSHGGPLRETDPLLPTSEYGATKAAADLALGVLAEQGLRTIRFRLFNHTGPHQTETFVVPSFATQIARIERGMQPPLIKVGNLEAERDFLDVRDVAEAYVAAILRTNDIPPGAVLNICSGKGVRIRAILDEMIARSSGKIVVEVDPTRWRANDTPVLIGEPSEAMRLLSWQPRRGLSGAISDILDAFRSELA
jgi:GDP-4-dehydro-6-deoxy-D-mannose reductase